jgi:hypothetical protein
MSAAPKNRRSQDLCLIIETHPSSDMTTAQAAVNIANVKSLKNHSRGNNYGSARLEVANAHSIERRN